MAVGQGHNAALRQEQHRWRCLSRTFAPVHKMGSLLLFSCGIRVGSLLLFSKCMSTSMLEKERKKPAFSTHEQEFAHFLVLEQELKSDACTCSCCALLNGSGSSDLRPCGMAARILSCRQRTTVRMRSMTSARTTKTTKGATKSCSHCVTAAGEMCACPALLEPRPMHLGGF